MKNTKIPTIAGRNALDRVIAYSDRAPDGLAGLEPHVLIRMLRHRLRMSQSQLARRVGLPQSHIAKIESGRTDMQLGTARRIFSALFCGMVILPRPERDLDKAVAGRVRVVAKRNVARVSGTMAMEKQLPERGVIRELEQSEERKINEGRAGDLWRD